MTHFLPHRLVNVFSIPKKLSKNHRIFQMAITQLNDTYLDTTKSFKTQEKSILLHLDS